jgi:hypothetical protein
LILVTAKILLNFTSAWPKRFKNTAQKTLDIGEAVLLIGTALFKAPSTGSRSPAV